MHRFCAEIDDSKHYQYCREIDAGKLLQCVIKSTKKTPPDWWINMEIKNSNNPLENSKIQKCNSLLHKQLKRNAWNSCQKKCAKKKRLMKVNK